MIYSLCTLANITANDHLFEKLGTKSVGPRVQSYLNLIINAPLSHSAVYRLGLAHPVTERLAYM